MGSTQNIFFWKQKFQSLCIFSNLTLLLNIVSAKDSLEFLVRWLERFPRYKTRDVFLTGESYAGHYVPQLAREILAYNAKSSHPIRLKGIMVSRPFPSLLSHHPFLLSFTMHPFLQRRDLNNRLEVEKISTRSKVKHFIHRMRAM